MISAIRQGRPSERLAWLSTTGVVLALAAVTLFA
jgi:hypothetical protein